MMNLLKNLIVISGIFLLLSLKAPAKGRDVTIVLKDNTEKQGELLLVRDTVIALLTTPVFSNKDILNYPQNIVCIKMTEVYSIVLHEVSGTTAGALTAVATAGGLAAANADFITDAVPEILAGFGLGFLAGWMFQSENEKIFSPVQKDFWDILEYVRFEPEPKYISEFIGRLLIDNK